ncbi:MAG: hypothetical protein J7L32_05375 [Thermoplasmata archaeon]|nr:hypothetical protein [Thermoplasmata archaeon]
MNYLYAVRQVWGPDLFNKEEVPPIDTETVLFFEQFQGQSFSGIIYKNGRRWHYYAEYLFGVGNEIFAPGQWQIIEERIKGARK